jgi:hypothetical protein
MAHAIVQIEHHGRIIGESHQQVLVSAHAVSSEHIDFHRLLPGILALGVASAKKAVPEESHFLLQRPLGVDHAEDPLFLLSLEGVFVQPLGLVPHHDILVEFGLRFGMQQLLHGRLIAFRGSGLYLRIRGSKPCAAHQVSHQCDSFVGHVCSPFSDF